MKSQGVYNWNGANRRLGKRWSVGLYYETRLLRRELDGQTIAVQHHFTDVVTYLPGGDIVLNTNGWRSVTTKARLNTHTPAWLQIYQEDWTWYVSSAYAGLTVEYRDGMIVHKDGTMSGAGPVKK